jgi:formate dehydrogenase iron-sulfur subunit
MRPNAILIDVSRCVGCRACVAACMSRHGVEGDPFDVDDLSARSHTALRDVSDEIHVRRLCMHCLVPSCASVCPVSALRKTESGPVTYDASRCLGCRYCIQACPFGVPRYEWDEAVPAVAKCDMCAERQGRGELPACVEACPVEAATFGPRDELLAEAHRRIAAEPGKYVDHVYGESEIGGTSVLFLSPVPFDELGLPVNLAGAPLPVLTGEALHRVPGIVCIGGALLWSIWWITRRREEVAAVEAGASAEEARR